MNGNVGRTSGRKNGYNRSSSYFGILLSKNVWGIRCLRAGTDRSGLFEFFRVSAFRLILFRFPCVLLKARCLEETAKYRAVFAVFECFVLFVRAEGIVESIVL